MKNLPTNPGVYFIRAGETVFVKIGFASNVAVRLHDLQAGNHEPLLLIRHVPGSPPDERWFHFYFAHRRVRREWFTYCDEMLTVIPDPSECRRPIQRDDALMRAICAAGGAAKLARELGVTSQAISQWSRVPPERVRDVERATGGRVSRHELRPDVFGEEAA